MTRFTEWPPKRAADGLRGRRRSPRGSAGSARPMRDRLGVRLQTSASGRLRRGSVGCRMPLGRGSVPDRRFGTCRRFRKCRFQEVSAVRRYGNGDGGRGAAVARRGSTLENLGATTGGIDSRRLRSRPGCPPGFEWWWAAGRWTASWEDAVLRPDSGGGAVRSTTPDSMPVGPGGSGTGKIPRSAASAVDRPRCGTPWHDA